MANSREKNKWIWGTSAQRLCNSLTDVIEERFNKNFWELPEPLYHGTPSENVESIKQNGLQMQHKSRGLSNRHIHRAVFTEKNPKFLRFGFQAADFAHLKPIYKISLAQG